MARRGGVTQNWKRTALAALAVVSCVTLAAPGSEAGGPRKNLERGVVVDIPGAEAVLYEVTENMYLIDAAGNVVGPDKAVSRKAEASLAGWARLGTPLCPSELMVTNLRTATCAVTAEGIDNISLWTGQGGVDGTFAVVVQDDSTADAPEYVVMGGTFTGKMDLSIRPLGRVTGTFVSRAFGTPVPFCGTFRLPFALVDGKRENPRRGYTAYYLANDGVTLIEVAGREKSLGMPTVRLELNFGSACQ